MLKYKYIIIIGISLAIGGILLFQLFNLTTIALWHDEAFSALLAQKDFSEMMSRISQDVHPPLYYILLRPISNLFDTSLFSLRLFSLFFGMLSIIATYILAKEILKKRSIAILSSIFMFFNAFQIQYNMEARMYTLGTFLALISSISLIKALKHKSIEWWILYGFIASASIYTHYYLGFILLAQGLFAIIYIHKESKFSFSKWIKNKNLQLLLLSITIVILSFLPWIKTFITQVQRVENAFWIPSMTIWSIPSTLFKMLSGFAINPNLFSVPLISIITTILVLAAIFLLVRKYKQTSRWLILFSLITPFLVSLLLSLKTSIYLDRYFILFLPFLLITIAAAFISIKNTILRNSLITIFMLATFISFPMYWNDINPEERPGMAAASAYINKSAQLKDKIIINSSFVYFTFTYYNKTNIHPVLFAVGDIPHFSGTALLDNKDITEDFNKGITQGDTIWTIDTTGFGNFQPNVPSSWKKDLEKVYEDSPDFKGSIIVRKYTTE